MRRRLVSFAVAILVALGSLVALVEAFLMPGREDEPAAAVTGVEAARAALPPTVGRTFGRRASRAT